ncbi:METTL5 family protein [Candidatus Methanarcanum hacksteinii]|uniref:METTL5 family protein n=1 Tax=Candidatus Methanarcanum hacksteinii TaxID=2911857 RepID=UPI0037DD0BC5
MKRKELEMRLQRVAPFDDPSAALEQYPTPSTIASDILFSAYVNGDVCDKTVNDLGCGTGIFSIGAKLLGADVVRGYDISRSALDVARKNIELLNVDVELMECDVTEVNDRADTTFMNPPFGCQNRRADRPFLDKAMGLSDSIYSIHMADTLDFLNEYIESKGREIVAYATYKYNIPHTFTFHRKEKKEVDIVVVNVR